MLRRGCTLSLIFFGVVFAGYFTFLNRYLEWPGNLIAAGFGALFGAMGLGGVSHLLWAWRDTAAFRRASRRQAPSHGALAVVAGPIRPLGAPLTSPFSGQPCVAYEYEVAAQPTTSEETGSAGADLAGFAMAACAVETTHGSVRLLGFAMLDEFPKARERGPEAGARARRYATSTSFEAAQGLGALRMFSALDEALADADGIVRKDFRLTDKEIPFEQRPLAERIVGVGVPVCALGRYDAERRALVPGGATLNRLWPGTPGGVRRSIVATARSQATIGLFFFVVSHSILGGGFYLSETRYGRVPEAEQASAIGSAVQDHDIPALERAVRRGANPNARDAFGDAAILDVREAELAAALIRLGADVNVRHRGDNDTPLIRAARMGIVPLVRVLLAAHADVHAQMTDGATALSEAQRGGHEDVEALLRAAGAGADGSPVERSRP